MEGTAKTIYGLLVILFAVGAYMLPAIVAFNRKHQNATAIFMLDLFLGWSFIGWVIAIIWSCTHIKKEKESLTVDDLVKFNLSNGNGFYVPKNDGMSKTENEMSNHENTRRET